MTVFVLGAAGQVGRVLAERGGNLVRGFDRAACDICDEDGVARAVDAPDVSAIVNCAAYTAVDRAESEPALAFAVNDQGAAIVARAASKRGVPIVHLSTDYVYGGRGDAPLNEDEPSGPLNVYGASKAAGDGAVAAANPKHIVLRVSWIFGAYGANFVKTMMRLGRERAELRIVDDQTGGPTEARDIADAVLAIAAAVAVPGFDRWGVYHFAGAPAVSWFAFAQAIFATAAGPAPQLSPISTAEYPTAAERPLNSRLDCAKIHRTFGLAAPDWRASLERVVTTIEAARQ